MSSYQEVPHEYKKIQKQREKTNFKLSV